MLTPFQRQDLDLFNNADFRSAARAISTELAEHVARICTATHDHNMATNELGGENSQLIEALENFADQPEASTAQSRRAIQLAEQLRSELDAAERP